MNYLKYVSENLDWSKFPTIGSIANSPKMKSVLDFYSSKNRYAAKNREMWEIALDQLRYEEQATRRRNEARRS